jgi:hypothetical protein
MHTNKEAAVEAIIQEVEHLDRGQLERLRDVVEDRLRALAVKPSSSVLERRSYGQGVLQLETRAYRCKDGSVAERGPYWYFHYREQGRQRTLYVGKTDEPEERVAERL